jgi:hypothetical protein
MSDFLDRYKDALGLSWKRPPKRASQLARRRPSGDPLEPAPSSAARRKIRPQDVRATALEGPATGAMTTHSLPGANVTLMITPPEGDGLWTIQGRIWLDPRADVGIRVALCQGENVLAETSIRDGGSFKLEDLITEDWSLEFHVEDGRVVVVQGPAV